MSFIICVTSAIIFKLQSYSKPDVTLKLFKVDATLLTFVFDHEMKFADEVALIPKPLLKPPAVWRDLQLPSAFVQPSDGRGCRRGRRKREGGRGR